MKVIFTRLSPLSRKRSHMYLATIFCVFSPCFILINVAKAELVVTESIKRLFSFFLAYWTALFNAFRRKPSLGTPDIRFRHISSTDKEVLGHYLNSETIHDKSSSSWISTPLIPWKYHVLLINYYFIHIIKKNDMSRSRLDWFYTAKKGKLLEINHLKKWKLKPKPINVEVFMRRTKFNSILDLPKLIKVTPSVGSDVELQSTESDSNFSGPLNFRLKQTDRTCWTIRTHETNSTDPVVELFMNFTH